MKPSSLPTQMRLVLVITIVMGRPWPNLCRYDNCVLVCAHGVLRVCRNNEEATRRVSFRILKIQFVSHAYLQCPFQNCNPGLNRMPMMFVVAFGDEESKAEWFSNCRPMSVQEQPNALACRIRKQETDFTEKHSGVR